MKQKGGESVSDMNPFVQVGGVAQAYIDVRPGYPQCAIDVMGIEPTHTVLDVGAGTGKLTARLLERSSRVWAVEPAADMRAALRRAIPDFPPERLLGASAELLPVGDASVDVLTYGQCWHWLDERQAAIEAARVLRPGGSIAIMFNQLDVRQPWVHRLSRIMRSGDVHRADRAPDLRVPGHHGHMERPFTDPVLTSAVWLDPLTPPQIAQLATTRSSWIRADDAGRARMRANLEWYMYEHLGWRDDAVVGLPYQLQVWTASRCVR